MKIDEVIIVNPIPHNRIKTFVVVESCKYTRTPRFPQLKKVNHILCTYMDSVNCGSVSLIIFHS